MAESLVVTLLSERAKDELEQLLERTRADVARLQIEAQQIEEALTRQARREARRSSRPVGRATQSGQTRERILDAVRQHEGAISPAEVIAVMEADGPTPSRGAIHTTIGRLVKQDELERVGEGQYQLASRNGADSAARTGPHENEPADPLFTGSATQEAS